MSKSESTKSGPADICVFVRYTEHTNITLVRDLIELDSTKFRKYSRADPDVFQELSLARDKITKL